MNFSDDISFRKYADDANREMENFEGELSQTINDFENRMNGKSKAKIKGSIFATIVWIAAVVLGYAYVRNYLNDTIRLVCLGIALWLFVTMLFDEICNLRYYGKISSSRDYIIRLKNRVNKERNSISLNQDAFLKSGSAGWNYPLSVKKSVSEEISSIESNVSGMNPLEFGFIKGIKEFLFFVFTIDITAVGSYTVFETVGKIMGERIEEHAGYNVINVLGIICFVITFIAEIILAKAVWSKTNCFVTNATLLIVPAGPAIFLALLCIASLIAMVFKWIILTVVILVVVAIVVAYISGRM